MTYDEYYMALLPGIAAKSKDPNAQFGAIAVDPGNFMRATGFNSFVRGLDDNVPERQVYPEAYKWMEHAERNLVYTAAREGISLKGCRIYVGANPCIDCARAIISSGFTEVIFDADGAYSRRKRYLERGPEHIARYIQQEKDIITMFRECGVKQRAIAQKVDVNA